MCRLLLIFFAAGAFFGADDPWTKVRQLKSGTEIRIYKKGAAQPVLAKFDEANEDRLVAVVKNEQLAIPKDQIDRLDCRPVRRGPRVTKESKTTTGANPDVPPPGPHSRPSGPSSSTSSGLSIQSKPDFETIYRRPALSGR